MDREGPSRGGLLEGTSSGALPASGRLPERPVPLESPVSPPRALSFEIRAEWVSGAVLVFVVLACWLGGGDAVWAGLRQVRGEELEGWEAGRGALFLFLGLVAAAVRGDGLVELAWKLPPLRQLLCWSLIPGSLAGFVWVVTRVIALETLPEGRVLAAVFLLPLAAYLLGRTARGAYRFSRSREAGGRFLRAVRVWEEIADSF